jgi:hypothetical protein
MSYNPEYYLEKSSNGTNSLKASDEEIEQIQNFWVFL